MSAYDCAASSMSVVRVRPIFSDSASPVSTAKVSLSCSTYRTPQPPPAAVSHAMRCDAMRCDTMRCDAKRCKTDTASPLLFSPPLSSSLLSPPLSSPLLSADTSKGAPVDQSATAPPSDESDDPEPTEMHTHTHTHTRARKFVHAYSAYVNTQGGIHTHVRTNVHTHTHTHAHTTSHHAASEECVAVERCCAALPHPVQLLLGRHQLVLQRLHPIQARGVLINEVADAPIRGSKMRNERIKRRVVSGESRHCDSR